MTWLAGCLAPLQAVVCIISPVLRGPLEVFCSILALDDFSCVRSQWAGQCRLGSLALSPLLSLSALWVLSLVRELCNPSPPHAPTPPDMLLLFSSPPAQALSPTLRQTLASEFSGVQQLMSGGGRFPQRQEVLLCLNGVHCVDTPCTQLARLGEQCGRLALLKQYLPHLCQSCWLQPCTPLQLPERCLLQNPTGPHLDPGPLAGPCPYFFCSPEGPPVQTQLLPSKQLSGFGSVAP